MKPVQQTKFGKPDGNCFAACVASVLELHIDDVPNPKGARWYLEVSAWLASAHGVTMIDVAYPVPPSQRLDGVWCIANGSGPRELRHSVVWRNGVLHFDPHPSGHGLVGDPDTLTLFVPQDPARCLP